jgi:hypothetical protein
VLRRPRERPTARFCSPLFCPQLSDALSREWSQSSASLWIVHSRQARGIGFRRPGAAPGEQIGYRSSLGDHIRVGNRTSGNRLVLCRRGCRKSARAVAPSTRRGCPRGRCRWRSWRTSLRPPPAPSRHPRQKTSPPSSHNTSRPPIPSAANQDDGPTRKPRRRAGSGAQLCTRYEHLAIRRPYGDDLIFYRVLNDTVEILRVLHGPRDYEPMLFHKIPQKLQLSSALPVAANLSSRRQFTSSAREANFGRCLGPRPRGSG